MTGPWLLPFSQSLCTLAAATTGAGVAESALPSAWWTILLAWLIGSTPFGFLAGKLKGIDIREHGSGNIGATNVLRVLGKPIGITTLVLDVLKGLVPVIITQQVVGPDHSLVPILAAVATILGHNYTFWLGFKGGKGIATSAGAIAPLIPIPLAIALLLWGLSFAITRYVSIASIVAAVSLPVTAAIQAWRAGQWDWPLLVFTLFLAVMATWRHRSNLKRLREGTESRFEPRKKREGASSSDESAS
ncbi:MAG: glycerol-3-phosphate 1-O-acyltransferase PlsY [Verrucomicrobiae bacterium]|nr:glycerol-3-phosphate 1-O-acyltransferase PlsY [Verrucomicrobiae bacterium]